MRIACLGGGPAGLYFAISMKLRDPAHQVDLFERNRPDDTFGWGVVFSDQTVENLMANDPVSGAVIAASSPIGTISTSISRARRSAPPATASSASAASAS